MKNSKMKHLDLASSSTKTRMIGIKNRLKTIVTSALLLAATSATADIISLPSGGQYIYPALAPVNVQRLDESIIRFHTTGLNGELVIEGSDFPPEYDIATTANVVLPFEQELELVADVDEGTVSGIFMTKYVDSATTEFMVATMEVRGNATCLPLNGRECGQLVLDLELQGVLSDPNDPSKVGQVKTVMLGSLVWDDTNVAHWAAISANTTIGGNEELINSIGSNLGDANLDGK